MISNDWTTWTADTWRTWSADELQDQVSPSSMVPGRDITPYLAQYAAAGAALYGDASAGAREVVYGDHPDEVLTWVPAVGRPDRAATFAFIHGGYWRALSHRDGLSAARAMAAAGINTVSINYTLTPNATLEQLVEQCRRAVRFVVASGELPVDRTRMLLSGHSAGAHLAAMVHDDLPDAALVLVSGVFDLEPLLTTTVNEPLMLDSARATSLSPLHRPSLGGGPALVLVGERDTDHFKDQSRRYAELLRSASRQTELLIAEDCDHFDVVDELGRVESATFRWLRRFAVGG